MSRPPKSFRLVLSLLLALLAVSFQGGGFTARLVAADEVCRPTTGRLDVVFLIDQTASMRDVLDTAKREAASIASELRRLVPDTAFGVASFADYPLGSSDSGPYGIPGDEAYRLQQQIDTGLPNFGGIGLNHGGDRPEAYSRAISEMPGLGWRSGARRIVILIGDSSPHSLRDDVNTFGDGRVDPGRDGNVGTSDDIARFSDAVTRASDAGITIVGLAIEGSSFGPTTRDTFTYAAGATGGQYRQIPTSASIATPIAELVAGVICSGAKAIPANVWGGLTATPNLAAAPGSLISYDLHVRNWDMGRAQWATVRIPFDPTAVSIVDAKFNREDMWVSALSDRLVTVQITGLGPKASAGGTLRFRVLPTAAASGRIVMQPDVTWGDGTTAADQARHLGNTVTTLVGTTAAGEATLSATPTVEQIIITGTGFAPWEYVDTWYNLDGKDKAAQRVMANGDGAIRVVLERGDLPATQGAYRLVARGVYSYDTKVATFVK